MLRKEKARRSSNFYRVYLINMMITTLFIGIVAVLSIAYSSKFILENITGYTYALLEEKRNTLDENTKQLQEIINMSIEDEEVIKLILAEEAYELPAIKYLNIIKHLKNICSNHNLVEGINIIDEELGIVLTDTTKWLLEEDIGYRDEIKKYSKEPLEECFTIREGDDKTQIEYIKVFEPIKGKKRIYVTLKINEENFFKDVFAYPSKMDLLGYTLINNSQLLSSNKNLPLQAKIEEQIKGIAEGFQQLTLEGNNFILYKAKGKLSNLSLVWIQDYTLLTKEADSIRGKIITISLLLIGIASVIIYVYVVYLFKPLRALSNKLKEITLIDEEDQNKSEYHIIEGAVDKLQDENNRIAKKYQDALPSYIYKTIQHIITAHFFDEQLFESVLASLKKQMNYEYYSLVITEKEAKEKARIMDKFNTYFEGINQISSIHIELSPMRTLSILNTDLEYEALIETVQKVKERINNQGIEVTFCVSQQFKNRDNIIRVYEQLSQKIEEKFFKGKNVFIYDNAPPKLYQSKYHNKELEKRLMMCVAEGEEGKAFEVLHQITLEIASYTTEIKYTCFLYFEICTNLIQNIMDLGIRTPKVFNEKEIFTKIFEVESLIELEEIAQSIAQSCIEQQEHIDKTYSSNIEKALLFIDKNYMKDLSLEDVAGEVYLSAGYLSNIFKEEMGMTIFEYITSMRMKKASELLLETPAIKIKEISEKVGYNNVQSFIRYFKKYYGTTPIGFRKEMTHKK